MSGIQKKNIQPKQQKPFPGKPSGKKESSTGIIKWAPIAILVFTALLYRKAIYNDFVGTWDDNDYILKNQFIRDFSINGIKTIFSTFYFCNYHPLTTLIYLLEYTCCGLNPLPYHLLNVLLHLLNTWLVFKLAEQLSGKKLTAILVSLLFAVHPMHVESVAWISELKDVLYTSFYLLSLMVYLRYMEFNRQAKFYIGALLLFICSLLSKSAAVTLPVLLIAVDIYKGRKINARSLLEKVPFILLSLLFGILAVLSQHVIGAKYDFPFPHSFIERIFLFTYTIAFYIVKLVAPFSLSAMHYPDTMGTALPWQYYASLPFLLLLVWLVIRRNPQRKEVLFGASFFLITISVMLQIVHIGNALTAERYAYVSYIGLFFIAGQLISGIVSKSSRKFAIAICLVFALIFSFQTWTRIGIWKNGEVLFTDVINKNPDVFHAYWMRGEIKSNNGDLQGAFQDFTKALELKPDYASGLAERGDVRNKLNDYQGALADLNLAIKLDPTIAEAYNNRGAAYFGLGDKRSAMLDYNKAIQLKPKLAEAFNNRASLEANTDDLSKAIKDVNTAIALSPGIAEFYRDRGEINYLMKDFKEAINDFNYSLKLKPGDLSCYYFRGMSRLNMADTAGACNDWKISKQLGCKEASEAVRKYCH